MSRWLNWFTNLFPVWVVVTRALALVHPPWFKWFSGQWIVWGLSVLLAVFLLHAGGFALGWLMARLFGYEEIIRRTISIEVGMQNSGLGVVLAQNNFPAMPDAATPCAISAVFHLFIGSLLAGVWRWLPPRC